MKALVTALTVCSFFLDANLSYWELKALDIPPSHIQYFLGRKSNDQGFCVTGDCQDDDPNDFYCWGYEKECNDQSQFSKPYCIHHHVPWASTLEDQVKLFWEQGDFGYIKKMKNQVLELCQPKELGDSSLTCTTNLWYCHATDIYFDFKNLKPDSSTDRFREDVFREGEVGGHCDFKKDLHKDQSQNKSPLQSWFAELEHFTSLSVQPVQAGICDVVIDKPTIFMKLDAGVNLYHHFCDFVNLYVTQHMNGSFSTDVNIVMWDTSSLPYRDFFSDTWKAFTKHPIIHLKDYAGKQVCFREAVFSFNPRMIRGLYYNMPLVPSCVGSGLFKAFSEHLLHRLGITQSSHSPEEFRITLLTRSTKYRKILNQDELVGAMMNVPMFKVKVIDYTIQMPFLEQLKVTHNSDIFIGMHGAGLTHGLFLPDWAVLFELYNTEDPNCYSDLARLRGVNYITWEDKAKLFQEDEGHHPTLGAHSKFTNYAFNVDEFMRLIYKAADAVKDKREKFLNS
ncbi:EGF domain-specific O-linked N-acetylglucosamine transferase-like isoform X1 [Montipora capricornis]|uniref:EGF domain-specific O-linked N-acetylglucosamine transferase-like isoform X1 n=1 Tax=Montipora capricornis TaxID=246305 RepID=UPI0035F13DEE